MSNGFEKLAEGVGNAIQTVPELYEDAFQPTVQEAGKFVARIPRAINAAFSGLDKWILNKEYSVDETKKLLAQKLENVEPEKIVEPEPYVAIPALQALSYSMNSKELRNLYANLLAKSMNVNTKDKVHPIFVDIIRKMSPLDAYIIKIIYLNNSNDNLFDFIHDTNETPNKQNLIVSFCTLDSLGLIHPAASFTHGYDIYLGPSNFYSHAAKAYYKKDKTSMNKYIYSLMPIHGRAGKPAPDLIQLSALGKSFSLICLD